MSFSTRLYDPEMLVKIDFKGLKVQFDHFPIFNVGQIWYRRSPCSVEQLAELVSAGRGVRVARGGGKSVPIGSVAIARADAGLARSQNSVAVVVQGQNWYR